MNQIRSFVTAALLATLALVSLGATAGPLNDYGENKVIDALFRAQSIAAPASWHLGMTTDTCTGDTGNGTEPVGNGYARIAVTSSLANWAGTQSAGSTTASSGSSGTTSNNTVLSMPSSTGAWGNLQAIRLYDASTAGNAWICINLNNPINVTATGFTVTFPVSQLTFRVDD